MSHITKVKTQLKDGFILRKALRKLGYQIKEEGSRESRETKDLDFTARNGSTWLGFKRSRENQAVYEMLANWERIRKHREEVISAIYQTYSQEKIMDLARVKGYAVMQHRMTEKGQIEIVLRKVG